MKVSQIAPLIDADTVVAGDGKKEVSSVYAGDFLSRVMGKAPADCIWLTVMANVNVAGVAVLAEIPAIVLCEGVKPDEMLVQKCLSENIALFTTQKSVYECCKLL
ncbi:MAG: serine kinase [Firmicutes bacterium]|nr:serine kinase [Bacillota bacterium]